MKSSVLRQQRAEFQKNADVEFAESAVDTAVDGGNTLPNQKWQNELTAYMAPFRRFPAITMPEHYTYLFEAYNAGKEPERTRARDLLVYGNIRLVLRVALRHTGRGLSLLDLAQEGVFGLIRAIEKFEIEKGFRFSTYAHQWIRQAMTRSLADRNEKSLYRIPVHMVETMNLVRRALSELYLKSGHWPKDLQVYEWVKAQGTKNAARLTLADVVRLVRLVQEGKDLSAVRLDAPAHHGDGDDTIGDNLYVGPPKTETIVEARRLYEEYSKALERIERAVNELPARSAMVVRLRYGLGDFEAMTLEEVGQRYDVTRERIRQIEAKALEELEAKLGITPAEIAEIIDVTQDLEVVAHAI